MAHAQQMMFIIQLMPNKAELFISLGLLFRFLLVYRRHFFYLFNKNKQILYKHCYDTVNKWFLFVCVEVKKKVLKEMKQFRNVHTSLTFKYFGPGGSDRRRWSYFYQPPTGQAVNYSR